MLQPTVWRLWRNKNQNGEWERVFRNKLKSYFPFVGLDLSGVTGEQKSGFVEVWL
jgi:hypothetical protein